MLTGGSDPTQRLAIHRRHFHASLTESIRTRFPATAWLIGDEALTHAAQAYVAAHPPRVFCLAEFGHDFPPFLASQTSQRHLPSLEDFATLEWHLGLASVAVDAPPLAPDVLGQLAPEDLAAGTCRLQPGVVYLTTMFPVDELMRAYLTDQVPERFEMAASQTHIEVRGTRGDIQFIRLERGTWHFRRHLQSGASIEAAAEQALEQDSSLNPGHALVELIHSRLLTHISSTQRNLRT